MPDMILVGQFTASKVGVNGLTVAVDIEAIEIATGTRTAHTTGASATAVGRRGLYTYQLTGATPATHVYIGTFITATTSVDQQEVAALAMVVPDELVSTRATAAGLATVQADIDDIRARLPAALFDGLLPVDVQSIATDSDAAFALQQSVSNLLNLDAAVSSRATPAQVNAEVDTALADVGLTTTITGRIDAAVSTRSTLTAAQVWDALTSGLATVGSIGKLIVDKLSLITTATRVTVNSPVDGGKLTITKAVTFSSGTLTATAPANWTKAYFTLKRWPTDNDSASLVQILVSKIADPGDGLQFLNGEAADTRTDGALIVDEENNAVEWSIKDNATAVLGEISGLRWDVKFILSDGESTRPIAGTGRVVLPSTLTIT